MKYSNQSGISAALLLALACSGCTHRDAPPATPVENVATPTYRSTTNSYELNTAPHYTQAGINGGEPATLPAIASPQRFSQNTPLAFAVYNEIHADQSINSRYVSVFSKGGTIELLGTVSKADLPKVLGIVKKQSGVKVIEDKLQIR